MQIDSTYAAITLLDDVKREMTEVSPAELTTAERNKKSKAIFSINIIQNELTRALDASILANLKVKTNELAGIASELEKNVTHLRSVTEKLNKNGIQAQAIHSKKSQEARIKALNQFKSGKIRVLVATDIIARGIDIKFLPFVINYELPRSPKDFIHRIGRTGRAEAFGEAISLITPEDAHHFKVIQKKMGKIATLIDGNQLNLSGF